jgi:L-alanine-DL-glutamate epimerase-like enolase superfamily enzyme
VQDFQLAKEAYPEWLERPEGQMALARARDVSAVTICQGEELMEAGEWTFVETTHCIGLI